MAYTAEEDPLCHPGTQVLRNKLDLQSQEELDEGEAAVLTDNARFPFNEDVLDQERVVRAMIDSFQGNELPLAALIRDVVAG